MISVLISFSVNTKCQIRFNLNKADWLGDKIREIFRKRFARLVNKRCDVIISSDKARTQSENQEDCFKRLESMLWDCNKELLNNKPPTKQDEHIMDERARKSAQRRLRAKRVQSEKKKNRDPYEVI
ncbi:unnamed protein product [Gongylonema pulchrum]|uniref:RF_PROK_I domain-containing protein n=1 Tax=Gongylonema pulchrum TaxID=637853 RepID=A0A183DQ66_9BILA|nr:unnamed protein product [Gongylonema pulchrum]